MLRPAGRACLFALLTAVLVSGCVTFSFTPEPEPSTSGSPQTSPSPAPATLVVTPTTAPTSAASQPTPPTAPLSPSPSTEPTAVAGPPFPAPEPGVMLVDRADVFSAATEEVAASRIAEIHTDHDANVVVYTQFKPGSDAASTKRDAIALKLQWRLPDGLVIMWNTTRSDCVPGAADNAQIQLYAGTRFSAVRLSDLKREQIFEDLMVPLLRECKEDEALLAALDGIAADIRTPIPGSSNRPTSAEGACGDPEFELSGYRWEVPYEWFFQESSVPDDYDADEVLEVLTRSAANITSGTNDCGLPDRIDATATYVGTTPRAPCESDSADGYNSVGFAELPEDVEADTIAFVCPYVIDDHLVEADILINTEVPWALSEDECEGYQELLEATMTHEFGHVFGLSHVSERRHGDLTMSPTSNGPCDSAEITLGLGDILGLEELY